MKGALLTTPRLATFATTVIVSCAFSMLLTVGSSRASAQVSSKRYVDVTVTDPHGRLVTGLEQERFEIIENGVQRAVTAFSDTASPISLAIVSEEPLPTVDTLDPQDEVIQASSVSKALRQLAASKNFRKVIVITTATEHQAIPSGIQTLQVDRADLLKAVIALRNQYRIEFNSSVPSASVEVLLRQPVGLPRLELNWK